MSGDVVVKEATPAQVTPVVEVEEGPVTPRHGGLHAWVVSTPPTSAPVPTDSVEEGGRRMRGRGLVFERGSALPLRLLPFRDRW